MITRMKKICRWADIVSRALFYVCAPILVVLLAKVVLQIVYNIH